MFEGRQNSNGKKDNYKEIVTSSKIESAYVVDFKCFLFGVVPNSATIDYHNNFN